MKMRIVLASLITSVILGIIWNIMIKLSYNDAKPPTEEQKTRLEQKKQQLAGLIKKELQELGTNPSIYDDLENQTPRNDQYQVETQAPATKPIGTWIGICRSDESRIALAKFDNNHYWLLFRDPAEGDMTEKGSYEFQYTDIYFEPGNSRSYTMEYERRSPSKIVLKSGHKTITLDKTDNVEVDF